MTSFQVCISTSPMIVLVLVRLRIPFLQCSAANPWVRYWNDVIHEACLRKSLEGLIFYSGLKLHVIRLIYYSIWLKHLSSNQTSIHWIWTHCVVISVRTLMQKQCQGILCSSDTLHFLPAQTHESALKTVQTRRVLLVSSLDYPRWYPRNIRNSKKA